MLSIFGLELFSSDFSSVRFLLYSLPPSDFYCDIIYSWTFCSQIFRRRAFLCQTFRCKTVNGRPFCRWVCCDRTFYCEVFCSWTLCNQIVSHQLFATKLFVVLKYCFPSELWIPGFLLRSFWHVSACFRSQFFVCNFFALWILAVCFLCKISTVRLLVNRFFKFSYIGLSAKNFLSYDFLPSVSMPLNIFPTCSETSDFLLPEILMLYR